MFQLTLSFVLVDMTAVTGGRLPSTCDSNFASIPFERSGDGPRLYLRARRAARSALICGEVVGRPVARIDLQVNGNDISSFMTRSESTATLNRSLSVPPGLVRVRIAVYDSGGQVSTVNFDAYVQ
jgi:hypothetical protein